MGIGLTLDVHCIGMQLRSGNGAGGSKGDSGALKRKLTDDQPQRTQKTDVSKMLARFGSSPTEALMHVCKTLKAHLLRPLLLLLDPADRPRLVRDGKLLNSAINAAVSEWVNAATSRNPRCFTHDMALLKKELHSKIDRKCAAVAAELLEANSERAVLEAANVQCGTTPMVCACGFGFLEVAVALLEAGADADRLTEVTVHGSSSWWTPLNAAATARQPDLVRELLERGARVRPAGAKLPDGQPHPSSLDVLRSMCTQSDAVDKLLDGVVPE